MSDLGSSAIAPLLGSPASAGPEHVRDVSHLKRFLERWTMDPACRQEFGSDPQGCLDRLGLAVEAQVAVPFVDPDAARRLHRAEAETRDGGYPLAVRRYRSFIREKIAHRKAIREATQPSDERFRAWRGRQVRRCWSELGFAKADGIVHAPVCFELSKGCTVGCWFCAVAAERFEQVCSYEQNAALWQAVLRVVGEVIGPCSRYGFCYWATDPLDNPDYERFIGDFHRILGRCPQTTTAIPTRDLDRTRRLLRLARALDSEIDRFSILTLKALHQVHAAFSPEELLRVELVPQNREALAKHRKANAGRARSFAHSKRDQLVPEGTASTIACVSGFLFNMVERSVRLITPCDASDRWPLGYRVLEEGRFDTAAELAALLEGLIRRNMQARLGHDDPVRLRPDLTWETQGETFHLRSRLVRHSFSRQPHGAALAAPILAAGSTSGELALALEERHGIAMPETFLWLDTLFQKGLLDEEPLGAAPAPARRGVA